MFGDLVVYYLFLGGAGAGACIVLALLGLLVPSQALVMGQSNRSAAIDVSVPYRRLFAPGYVIALIALILGILCLVADLGRADRLMLLFTSPTVTFVSVGAWALFLCFLLASVLVLTWRGIIRMKLRALRVVIVLSLVVSLVVIAYTGFLLQSVQAVPFWATPFVPTLFILSSLSCGIAIVFGAAQLSRSSLEFSSTLKRLLLLDMAIIVIELIVVIAFVVINSGQIPEDLNPTTQAALVSIQQLTTGAEAQLFWGGFVFLGLALPLVLEFVKMRIPRSAPLLSLAIVACVLIGGFILRQCIVAVGIHPQLMMIGSG